MKEKLKLIMAALMKIKELQQQIDENNPEATGFLKILHESIPGEANETISGKDCRAVVEFWKNRYVDHTLTSPGEIAEENVPYVEKRKYTLQ